uniref:Gastrula zinc finger protein XlCGF53.1-like n=1 Tax=Astyanax mexicanus TaxID=7994 RepID=A0A3B1JGL8_ASTMX
MSGAAAALEARVWSVMESLAKAAATEICALVDSQCVEMRLEIRRSQGEIQSLRGKVRDLRAALRDKPLSTAPQINPQMGEAERDMNADDLHQEANCEDKEEDKKTSSSGLINFHEDSNLDFVNSHLNSGITHTEFRQPQILSDSLNSEDKADAGGLNTAAVKLEAGSYSVSTAECDFENSQNDQKLCTDAQEPEMGDGDSPFGNIEDFHPQSYYPVQSNQSEEPSSCKYDAVLIRMNEPRNSKGNPSRVEFKIEPEEEPIEERINELPPCEMTDGDGLPWPFLTAGNFETQDMNFSELHQQASCKEEDEDKRMSSYGLMNLRSRTLGEALKCQDTADPGDFVNAAIKVEADRYSVPIAEYIFDGFHPQLNDPQLNHLAETSQTLPSCSIKHMVEPRAKQVHARTVQNRIQARNFQQNSTSRSAKTYRLKKPLSCPFCPKSFYRRYHLQVHLRTHTGEKPFGCAVCGKNFAHSSNLNVHQRIHTKEKPSRCTLCGKMFPSLTRFKRHMTLHEQGRLGP